jgi:hypothetical protein
MVPKRTVSLHRHWNVTVQVTSEVFQITRISWFPSAYKSCVYIIIGRLSGLVVTVPEYRSRGPGFDSQRYQIF